MTPLSRNTSNKEAAIIPVILFAFNRPEHLARTLEGLRANQVPELLVFIDGPRHDADRPKVEAVRRLIRNVQWTKTEIVERETNLGLGRSILTGVTEVLGKHESAIVFEDDLVCVPGTYDYLCAALKQYRDNPKVMSVTGWTHPRITPNDITDQPYFDGRAECLVWGTWARAWQGMDKDAKTLMEQCKNQSIDIYGYGADLVAMANTELSRNIWAVRLLYWHILNQGLCLRPPWSMVEHIGFDAEATNAKSESWLRALPLNAVPPIPSLWPEPTEHPACRRLHQKVCGMRPTMRGRLYGVARRLARRVASKALRAVSLK